MNDILNKVHTSDIMSFLPRIEDNSIDVIITDPPYFLDKMDNNWDDSKVSSKKYLQTIQSLPAGMKFDKEKGKQFYDWYLKVSKGLYRVLKPGGFFFSFSSPRLYHRMASAVDDAGFEIRDMFMWLYTQNQPKAMSINHFIDKMKINDIQKEQIKYNFNGWKTPQIKSCFEPIVMAQKPSKNTYLENMLEYEIGLMNTNIRQGDDMFPSNIATIENISEIIDKAFLVGKPKKHEKGDFNDHKTVKPLAICEYMISLTAFSENAVVFDPFAGSGTTLVAAKKLGKVFIGVDINSKYEEIAMRRLNALEECDVFKDWNLSQNCIVIDKKQVMGVT
ncbi:MAG: site-specific DNA-methyltransferase [Candidatus Cloacimonetes bacterium]|nr:site-specific DNA-methyltransferase [Candidatus Cloacimonadota bacterium]